jgi:hypothetical protein
VIDRVRNFLITRTQDYRRTFAGIHGTRVLDDLARFCRAHESTFNTDPRAEGILQGRREVWLRITRHMNMTEAQLWAHFNPNQEQ